jgi:N-formylglutamate deformylase
MLLTVPLFTLTPEPALINVPHAGTRFCRNCAGHDAYRAIRTRYRLACAPVLRIGFDLGAGLVATHSRYVVDLNRDPEGTALYRSADNTEFCPIRTFAYQDIYLADSVPSEEEIATRRTIWPRITANCRQS